MIRTHWDSKLCQHVFTCPSGERVELRHRAEMGKDGKRKLIRDVEIPTWDIIQSHKDECLIENILKRYKEGDLEAINKLQGTYTDITGAPKSLAEAQQLIIRLKSEFDELPKDIRQKFDYNVEQYVAEFGTDLWAEKTGISEALKKQEERDKKQIEFETDFQTAIHNMAQPRKEEEVNE